MMLIETTLDHLNSFWASLNHLCCPFLLLVVKISCLPPIMLNRFHDSHLETPDLLLNPLNLIKGLLSVVLYARYEYETNLFYVSETDHGTVWSTQESDTHNFPLTS